MQASGERRTSVRADGRRNRERILEVARHAFDIDDAATLQSIARDAGVGQGTLYRHFPTREALLVEVYRDEFDTLLGRASVLLQEPDAGEALRHWLDDLAAFGRKKHALSDVLDAAVRAQLHYDQRRPLLDAIELLLQAGRDTGTVRDDASGEDLLALVSFLWHLELDGPQVAHLLDVVIAGLRPGGPPRSTHCKA